MVEHLVPGRTREARPPDEKELLATRVVRLPIEEASAKMGPPVDETTDLELDVWTGVLPFVRRPGEPIPDEHMKAGIPVPEYVRNYPEGRT